MQGSNNDSNGSGEIISECPDPVTEVTAPLSDFRTIRMGDLNLLQEVGKQHLVEYHDVLRKRTGAVKRRVAAVVVRRINRARIYGSQEIVTAVLYESSDFEKEGLLPASSHVYPNPLRAATGTCPMARRISVSVFLPR